MCTLLFRRFVFYSILYEAKVLSTLYYIISLMCCSIVNKRNRTKNRDWITLSHQTKIYSDEMRGNRIDFQIHLMLPLLLCMRLCRINHWLWYLLKWWDYFKLVLLINEAKFTFQIQDRFRPFDFIILIETIFFSWKIKQHFINSIFSEGLKNTFIFKFIDRMIRNAISQNVKYEFKLSCFASIEIFVILIKDTYYQEIILCSLLSSCIDDIKDCIRMILLFMTCKTWNAVKFVL